MKVIHLNTSSSWGGLEQYTSLYIRTLAARGVENVALVWPGSRMEAELREAGVRTVAATRRSYLSPSDVLRIRREARQPHSIVQSHTRVDVWTGSWAVMGTVVPHVNHVYMIAVNKHDPLHRVIYGNVDAIVCTSETNNAAIMRGFPIPADRIRLIRYMRDPQRYAHDADLRTQFRTAWGVQDDTVVIGMMCRIDPQKGIREFVEALDMLPDDVRQRTQFVVVGEPTVERIDADGHPVFEPAAAAMDVWVREAAASRPHLCVVPFQRDVAGVLSAFDVFVLATHGEMYALSVIEAMMTGLPVIGTDSGGTPDQLRDGRGQLIRPRSAQAIADAVQAYVRDPALRASHAQRGRTWAVAEHHPDVVMQQWMDLYTSVLP